MDKVGQGISSFIMGKTLNHADKSVTSIYDRYSYDAEKRGALEIWETRLKFILTTRAKQEVSHA